MKFLGVELGKGKIHKEKFALRVFLFCEWLGNNIFWFRNVFGSGPTPAINNDRSLTQVLITSTTE